MEPDIDGVVVVSGLPAGSVLDNSKLTVTGTLISGPPLNSTVQVRVTSDPTDWMGLTESLKTITVGVGTGKKNGCSPYIIIILATILYE